MSSSKDSNKSVVSEVSETVVTDYDKSCDEYDLLLKKLELVNNKMEEMYQVLLKHMVESFIKINEVLVARAKKQPEANSALSEIYQSYAGNDEKAINKYFEENEFEVSYPSGKITAKIDLMMDIHDELCKWFKKRNVKYMFTKGGLIHNYQVLFKKIKNGIDQEEKNFWDIHNMMDKVEKEMDAFESTV